MFGQLAHCLNWEGGHGHQAVEFGGEGRFGLVGRFFLPSSSSWPGWAGIETVCHARHRRSLPNPPWVTVTMEETAWEAWGREQVSW